VFTHNIYRNVRVRVIVVRDGKLLLHQPVPDGLGRVFRVPPGGGLEPNETLYEAGEREVFEETGLRVRVTSVAFLREWVIPKHVSVAEAAQQDPAGSDQGWPASVEHAYGLEVYLWAELPEGQPGDPQPDDIQGVPAEWVPLAQIEGEPLFPSELRALARDLLEGRPVARVPSFATGLGDPHDQPDYDAFRQ
jgi:8-oxo-dGTP pyrophosphatase MutT (NUDIX family)